jgi:cytochrome c oxidase subunit 2
MLNHYLGIVDNASQHGFQIDEMLEFVHWFMLVLFVGWATFFLFALIRFHRSRNPKADYHGAKSKASTHIEFTVVLVEAVLLLGFAIPLWGKRVNGPRPENGDAVRVRVIAEQFRWTFHYPGPDGVFGRQKAELISGDNPLGLDYSDPAAKDDLYTSNELHIPLDKNVICDITSKDVIHSFALESMRIGQDAIPGSNSPIWFKPIKAGTYEIICAQLCGAGHYAMRAMMMVDPDKDYKEWESDRAQQLKPVVDKEVKAAAARKSESTSVPASASATEERK